MTAPVHVLYGGAHLFSARTPAKLGELARRALDTHGDALTDTLGISADVVARVRSKLEREPIEDLRIDFEDGFGVRSDDEEDSEASRTGAELARCDRPRIVGIRVKSSRERALRTLDRFVAAGGYPDVVTIPKVTTPEDIAFLVDRLPDHAGIEIMVEDVRALPVLRSLADAARGRCVAAHLGTYDLTASAGIAAPHQTPEHPLVDLARQHMLVAFSGTEVRVSDGATTVLPIGDRAAVQLAWKQHYRDVRRHLSLGFYQGWDLHPAQLVSRYAAVFAFYREALPTMSLRMKSFREAEERASRVGNVFDDAATGRGLTLFFERGVACGALDRSEVI